MKRFIFISLLLSMQLIRADEKQLLGACLKGTITRKDGVTEGLDFVLYKNGEKYKLMHSPGGTYRRNGVEVEMADGAIEKIIVKDIENTYLDVKAGKIVITAVEAGSVRCIPCEDMIPFLMHAMIEYEEKKIETEYKASEELRGCDAKIKQLEKKLVSTKEAVERVVNKQTDQLKQDIYTIVRK